MASYSEQQRAQAKQRRAADQAQVQKRLQAGRGIGLYSANPLEAAVQGIGSFFGITKPPTAFATQMQGKNQLVVPGGWNNRSNMPGNVNVVGRTWDLAQQGANAVYIPRGETTRFNTIVGRPTSAPPAPDLPPPLGDRSAAELAYQQEVSRVAQLTAQDPELQRYEDARQKAKLAGPGSAAEQSAEDLGMQIWAKKYNKPGDLASRVKPGQAGYDVIQRTLGAGQMGSPLNLPFDTNSPLGTTPPISPASYDAGKVAQGLGLSTVPRNAFAGASAAPYAGFSQGPTLQSAPLGFPSEMPTASYAGATGIQPMGSAVDKFDPKGPEAQRLLEMFKDSIFTTQK
jgi:hypothetical protein